ncbi:hypothetical protein CAPTEDRAFT_218323 [Capitella teleta]|uniref:Uncharacterized protein n=1 Tax=Capitella teleta TaxID=283909 RepID=R7UKX4_CAPTE|nr:hypothetical protein CAPTEDRAFT_218323 [Capitella teleta]|eukprot:ELU06890.1 hypothetical protein CAPTEDRAFT_218323 [Capitella teleta]
MAGSRATLEGALDEALGGYSHCMMATAAEADEATSLPPSLSWRANAAATPPSGACGRRCCCDVKSVDIPTIYIKRRTKYVCTQMWIQERKDPNSDNHIAADNAQGSDYISH